MDLLLGVASPEQLYRTCKFLMGEMGVSILVFREGQG